MWRRLLLAATALGSSPPERELQAICDGFDEEYGDCSHLPPCGGCNPVDCQFTTWGSWYPAGGCSGLVLRQRDVQVTANECGRPCTGAKIESAQKLLPRCQQHKVNCEFAAWTPWTACADPTSQATRKRTIARDGSHLGLGCLGATRETRACRKPMAQDCHFAAWQAWTACSASCGEGRRTRLRHVAAKALNGGTPCNDVLLEVWKCEAKPCPRKDCEVQAWSQWSSCGREHQRYRSRVVVRPASNGGNPCPKALLETIGCQGPAPSPCELSPWSKWSQCDKTCGGGQTFRQRRVERANEAGGMCDRHALRETEPCGSKPCSEQVLVKCHMQPWSPWSECSVNCGMGQESRKRSVQDPTEGESSGCSGILEELRGCERNECDEADCRWGDWLDWSSCSDTCGGGARHRTRMIEVAPTPEGKTCAPKTKGEVAPCNTEPCTGRCVDGQWGSWMQWSECSASCSSGFRSRRRDIEVQPNDCGQPALGLTEQYEVCQNSKPCTADQDCEVSQWGQWSTCSSSCFGIRERNRFITQFASGQGHACLNTAIKLIEACNPGVSEAVPQQCGPDAAVDCLLNPWQAWSGCSTSCGGGQRKRIRSIHLPPHFGGRPCHGALAVTAPCNVNPCPDESKHQCQDCQWGQWSEWGECSGCGGQTVRHRSIEQMANDCGKPCDMRSAKETTSCDAAGCGTAYYCSWNDWSPASGCADCGASAAMRNRAMHLSADPPTDYLFRAEHSKVLGCTGTQLNVTLCPKHPSCEPKCKPQNCEFGAWSEWAEPTWIGLCERHREIAHLNNECGQPCGGPILETKRCAHGRTDVSKDCVISAWTEWTRCLTNGVGQRLRSRHVVSNPVGDGEPCVGDLRETKPCVDSSPHDCQLSPWTEWSRCTHSCGKGGHQSRLRDVASRASGGGRQCDGALQELRGCGDDVQCPSGTIDCIMSKWSEWGLCDTDNQRYRSRDVAQLPKGGGMSCDGALKETETCSLVIVDCVMSAWTPWSQCEVSCGSGQAERQRQIQTFPERGGRPCPTALIETRGCNENPCGDQRDCVVGAWVPWGPCSATCGVGQQSRKRPVVEPSADGAGCTATLAETRQCHQGQCVARDCKWAQWSAWSDCSCTCGGGTHTRNRDIAIEPQNGGKRCEQGDKEQVEACNTQPCGQVCRDGQWASWTPWSGCSASCDRGVSMRHRTVAVSANHCGRAPIGKDREVKFCNEAISCERDIDCSLTTWSAWSACTATCGGVKRRARQVAIYGRGNGAYCQGALKETWPCNPGKGEQPPQGCNVGAEPQDCTFDKWTDWTACSSTCGGGQSHHTRGIVKYATAGGKGCEGPLYEMRQCGEQACEGDTPVDCKFGEWEPWGACGKCSGERKRFRRIVRHSRNGGRNCAPAETEQLGACPVTCHANARLFCTWQVWEAWGGCTRTCGRGKRVRRRYLHLTSDEGAMLPAPEQLFEEYEFVLRRTKEMEERHLQEVVMAFAAGCASLIAAFAVVRGACKAREAAARRGPYSSVPRTAVAQRQAAGSVVEMPLLSA